jgi:hypothetical protein
VTIASAILALSPAWYWKLDDATGPAASDSSGNGRPGAYVGGFRLLQPGPEAGTYGVQVFDGYAQKVAPGYVTSGQTATLLCWAAIGAVDTGVHTLLANASGTNGGSLAHQPASGGLPQLVVVRNNIANTSLSAYVLDFSWHMYAVVFTGTGVTAYIDGVAMGSVAGAVNAFNAGVSTSVGSAEYGYLAHFAGWASALTAGQIQGIYTAPAALQTPAFASQQSATGQTADDLSSILAKLDLLIGYVSANYQNAP